MTVLTQPTDGTCVIENGEGTVGGNNVTNISVNYATVKNFNFTGAEQTFVVPAGAAAAVAARASLRSPKPLSWRTSSLATAARRPLPWRPSDNRYHN